MKFRAFCAVLLLHISTIYTSALAQSGIDSLKQDYLHVYQKVMEYDMEFVEGMSVTAAKVFIIENPNVADVLSHSTYKDSIGEQEALRKLSSVIVEDFIEQKLLSIECKDGYAGFEEYFVSSAQYLCKCLHEKKEQLPEWQWQKSQIDEAQKCIASFVSQMDSTQQEKLKVAFKAMSAEQLGALQKCVFAYNYISCDLLRQSLVETAQYQADRHYYLEKGFRMSGATKMVNTSFKNGEAVTKALFANDVSYKEYTSVLQQYELSAEKENISLHEVRQDDRLTSIFFTQEKEKTRILYGVQYKFVFREGKPKIKGCSVLAHEDLKKDRGLSKGVNDILMAPVYDKGDVPPSMELLKH